jgi:SAM-dependent methyltransferase
LNPKSREIDLLRVQDEIRSEADELRLRSPSLPAFKPRPVATNNRAYDTGAREYSIANLCQFYFTTFLDYAYRAVLKRPPDAAGFDGHLKQLVAGKSKIEILGDLRFSEEGRRVDVRIPGLLPRYALTKVFRIPVLGYLAESLFALASLPAIVRHQRAADTFHVARSYEIDTARRETAQQIDTVVREHLVLRKEVGIAIERVSSIRGGLERMMAAVVEADRADIQLIKREAADLRQVVLSMNHWMTSLRQNLGTLERAEREENLDADRLNAHIAERLWREDTSRSARLGVWSDAFKRAMPVSVEVLDLGSGQDWLLELARQGVKATGVDANSVSAEQARSSGIMVSEGEPAAVLERLPDSSIDGISVLSLGAVLPTVPASRLLKVAMRALRPGGCLLLAFEMSPELIRARMAGRRESDVDVDLYKHALDASGFSRIETVTAGDGALCVMANKPANSAQT